MGARGRARRRSVRTTLRAEVKMTESNFTSLYRGATGKIWRRLRDLPWRLSQARDTLLPGDFAQLYRLVRPYSMVSNARLRGLYQAVRRVTANNIKGDLVECGAARGGSAALLG